MKVEVLFIILLLIACLIQVSWVPIPIGLLAIFWLVFRKGTKYIILPALIFSLSLAILSDIPAWLVLLTTSFSLYLFILGKSSLPSRLPLIGGLVIASLVVWEALLIGLLRLFN
ncbi:MAG: hypothetical protein A2126_03325 [Candidatus Woykebacteria bacterium GWB1_45_5]|uniref:Uncharacterized protein n=2 Tax=Candidatus Woykeibacteriota TaxID=1817899 RepID=A0A1G1W170_9BACT|nr:MAG: hypothetical protein A2113_04420 [Candidatus Woykebacteria bacterium GWA1_44_8]OGY24382.1 MAG: hypothetical protein A2126_03325 [Candidatus Woykebacteria bacterium GWB1_45_5]